MLNIVEKDYLSGFLVPPGLLGIIRVNFITGSGDGVLNDET